MKINLKNWQLLLLAISFLYLINLGNVALRDWDEGYYTTVARDMYKSGNWLYPTYLGEPFFLKPPLLFWLITISYHIGGVSEWTSRFPAAFISGCGVFLLYLLAQEIFPKKESALWTAIVYLTLLPVARHSRLAMLDGISNTFFLLSIWSIFKFQKRQYWALGIGIGLGLVTLTKGILVLAFLAILIGFTIWDKRVKILLSPYLWLGLIIGFTPVIAWYWVQYEHYGKAFIEVHFASQSINRITTSIEGHRQPFWYYGLELIKYSFPWLLFLPGGIIFAKKSLPQSWAKLTLVGFFLYLLMISLMQTKLPWYIMPLYPFLALAVGGYLGEIEETSSQVMRKVLIFFFYLLSTLVLVGAVYLLVKNPQPLLISLAVVLGVTFGMTAERVKKKQPYGFEILAGGLYLGLCLFMLSPSWVWEINEAFAVKPVASLIREHTPMNQIVYTSFAYSRPSLDFYSTRKVLSVDLATLEQMSQDGQKHYLLVTPSVLERLRSERGIILGTVDPFILWQTLR